VIDPYLFGQSFDVFLLKVLVIARGYCQDMLRELLPISFAYRNELGKKNSR